jgi:hypothetical protein
MARCGAPACPRHCASIKTRRALTRRVWIP